MATVTGTRVLENYVGGAWTPAGDASELLDVENPATGEVLARVPLSGRPDLDAAVRAAREALPAWRGGAGVERARRPFTLRERVDARRAEPAPPGTTAEGKTNGGPRAG